MVGRTMTAVKSERPELLLRVVANIGADGVKKSNLVFMDYCPKRMNVTLDADGVITKDIGFY